MVTFLYSPEKIVYTNIQITGSELILAKIDIYHLCAVEIIIKFAVF